MKFKRIVGLQTIAAILLLSLTGCGFSIGNITFGTKDEIAKQKALKNEDEKVKAMDLEDDSYYVLSNGEYTPLYFGNSSFKEGETTTSPSKQRLLWYIDDGTADADINDIPVLYKNDKLVYRYSDTLAEEFNFERFFDLGRSFGIYGLTETKSGRYSISIDTDLMYPDSDVYSEISTLTSETAIIEQMETIKLRHGSGMVSEYGTITNFAYDEKGNIVPANPKDEYRFLVYSGTYRNKFTFKPTYRILGSAETYVSYDFAFMDDDVIQIQIPTWFESGYYLINGVGLIKYINKNSDEISKKEIEKIDLNKPTITDGLEGNFNVLTDDDDAENVEELMNEDGEDHSEEMRQSIKCDPDGKWNMTVNTPGTYNITISLTYYPIEGVENEEDPYCELTTSNGETFFFTYDEENEELVVEDVFLTKGTATFKFEEFEGAKPTFNIEKSEE